MAHYAYENQYERTYGGLQEEQWEAPPPVGNLTYQHKQHPQTSGSGRHGSMKLAAGSKWWWWHVIAMCTLGINFLMLLVIIGLTAFIVHQVR